MLLSVHVTSVLFLVLAGNSLVPRSYALLVLPYYNDEPSYRTYESTSAWKVQHKHWQPCCSQPLKNQREWLVLTVCACMAPQVFLLTWKLLYMTLCCTIVYHWITRVFTRKPYCMPSVRSVKALSLYLRQTYAHHFSSLLPEISVPGDLGDLPAHLEYWTVHDLSCIKCGKTERHSNVVAIACHWRYLLNITPVLLSASSAYMSQ